MLHSVLCDVPPTCTLRFAITTPTTTDDIHLNLCQRNAKCSSGRDRDDELGGDRSSPEGRSMGALFLSNEFTPSERLPIFWEPGEIIKQSRIPGSPTGGEEPNETPYALRKV
ncbi:hypothetical protein AAFF_G00413560 [Aldrovandia affinis]|uniref:Uncharacterized protein n=1 Tax=Aldrovandia affinis TaxID=143900 RepID=A0AAD7SBK9_9TELE|nr:hypothetical protein AAFF_G00413560 [Aldrovandia affinis]